MDSSIHPLNNWGLVDSDWSLISVRDNARAHARLRGHAYACILLAGLSLTEDRDYLQSSHVVAD